MERIISSAKRVMGCLVVPSCIPDICGSERIFSARGSMIRLNIVGERGHPCLVPLEITNFLERRPEVKT